MDITLILTKKYPNSEWVLIGEDYENLQWLSKDKKPSLKELEAQWFDVQYEIDYENVRSNRQIAYQQSTDPLYFGWQRGDNTEQEWLDAVQAVKNAHPYPEETK